MRVTPEQYAALDELLAPFDGPKVTALRAVIAQAKRADALETALAEACDLAELPELSWGSGESTKLAELRALMEARNETH